MGTGTQQELFAREAPADLLAAVRQRLGGREVVRPSDVSAACNVSIAMVYAWMEEGLIESTNVSAGSKPYYQVFVPSVIRFYAQRLGVEEKSGRAER